MRQKRIAVNIGLLALALALAGLAYLRPGAGPEQSRQPPLTQADPAAVERIRIAPEEGAITVLQRDDGHWRMREPHAVMASESAVNALLGLLEAGSETRLGEVGQLDRYGLEAPAVTFEMAGHRLALGDEHPMEPQRYVRVDGTVHLVRAASLRQLEPAWHHYASRRLVPADTSLTRLELPKATLERAEQGIWQGEASGEGRVPEASARSTAQAWERARALEVAAAERETSSGPVARLHLAGRDAPLVYHIERREAGLRLHRSGPGLTYRLPGGRAEALLDPVTTAEAEEASGASTPAETDGSAAPGGGGAS